LDLPRHGSSHVIFQTENISRGDSRNPEPIDESGPSLEEVGQ